MSRLTEADCATIAGYPAGSGVLCGDGSYRYERPSTEDVPGEEVFVLPEGNFLGGGRTRRHSVPSLQEQRAFEEADAARAAWEAARDEESLQHALRAEDYAVALRRRRWDAAK